MEPGIKIADQIDLDEISLVLYNSKSSIFDKEDTIGNIVNYINNNYKILSPNNYDIYVLKIAHYLLRKYFTHELTTIDLKIFCYIIPACTHCINYYESYITELHHKTRHNFICNMMNKLMPFIVENMPFILDTI